jgi:PAS domain S-box-containing protein
MSETPSANSGDKPRSSEFRWQAFFHRAREPLFLLNRQRRILFVNRAWEELTGILAAQARGLACTRRQSAEPGPWSPLAVALCPPREVLEGQNASVRRLITDSQGKRCCWDIDFFPLQDDEGLLLVMGKIRPLAVEDEAAAVAFPEKLTACRRRLADHFRLDPLGSANPSMRRIADQVRLACTTRTPVMILGGAGTGKRHLARVIHHQGMQRERDFAALACGGLPEPALVAALFGESGFLERQGLGTLYLAEPARLPRDLQARVVQFLTESTSDGPRIIAGSRPPPNEESQVGRLSEELACALGTLVISLPPLRDRAAELAQQATHVLEQIYAEADRPVPGLTPAAIELLQAYSWPGNWRELRQVLTAAGSHSHGDRIDVGDLPSFFRLATKMNQGAVSEPERELPLDTLLEQAERRLILHALKLAAGNKTRAADILGIWRPRLLRRMEALGIQDPEASP